MMSDVVECPFWTVEEISEKRLCFSKAHFELSGNLPKSQFETLEETRQKPLFFTEWQFLPFGRIGKENPPNKVSAVYWAGWSLRKYALKTEQLIDYVIDTLAGWKADFAYLMERKMMIHNGHSTAVYLLHSRGKDNQL
ncbi:hypothetical protein CA11_33240 [Gimesia maris]|uniref:hypothetical protein n=1 Tax=Gimesia maris TaxID=122 RepID=UPI00118B132C|nr:hypothetical protein [Gimesia maris]QDU15499.1 hypothetical protein CA11_33240 [Gimesia maris]